MRKHLVLSVLALGALTVATAPAMAKDAKLGKGDYFVAKFPGNLPHTLNAGAQAQRLTDVDFDQLDYLDTFCRQHQKEQSPSFWKTLGLTTLRNMPGTMIFSGLAAEEAFKGVSGEDYGIAAGGASFGGSIGQSFTSQSYGKRNFMGSCMSIMVYEAKIQGRAEGVLRGVNIIYNAYAVNGKRIKRSSTVAKESLSPAQASQTIGGENVSTDAEEDGVYVPPPPGS